MQIQLTEKNYLLHLLAAMLHGHMPAPAPGGVNWEQLYLLAAGHSVSGMVWQALEQASQSSVLPTHIKSQFAIDHKKSIAREAAQHIAVEQIVSAFEACHISCMPLKGYIIKDLYPEPHYRSMADIDILFRDGQAEQIRDIMLNLGFTARHSGGNHDVYYRQPFLNVEMHRRLVAPESPYSNYLSNTWTRARLKPGRKCTYELSDEDLFAYILIHLAKHYANRGTGVRSVMDIWLYVQRLGHSMDWAYLWEELEKTGLREFSGNIMGLGAMWFGSGPTTETFEEMADYILASGTFGTMQHAIISSLAQENVDAQHIDKAKHRHLLKTFFPGRQHMRILYPIVDMFPFLMPVCWILRGIKSMLVKRRSTLHRIKSIRMVDATALDRMQSLRGKDGLR